jgi:hypothetical protein
MSDEDQIDMMHDSHALWQEIERLNADLATRTAERDEARREVCYAYGSRAETLAAAERRGWNCFDAKEVQR